MNDSAWDALLDDFRSFMTPPAFADFLKKANLADPDEEALTVAVQLYVDESAAVLIPDLFEALIDQAGDPSALTGLGAALDRLWTGLIDGCDPDGKSPALGRLGDALAVELITQRTGFEGLLAVLDGYLRGEAGAQDDANGLIRQARQAAGANLAEARRLFGRAGAAALLGADFWPLWPREIETPPVSDWTAALGTLLELLEMNNLMPCLPPAEQRARMAAQADAVGSLAGLAHLTASESGQNSDIERLMGALLGGESALTDEARQSLPALTPELIDQLIYVLGAEEYATEDSEGEGWAPIHAAQLLGESGAAQAVYPLIEAVADSDYMEILYSTALAALGALGQVALPRLLETLTLTTDIELKCSLAGALGKAGAGDDRAFRALEALYYETSWETERMQPMMALADQGDPRAKDIFYRSLTGDADIDPQGIREILGALEELDPDKAADLERLRRQAVRRYDTRYVRFDSRGLAFCRDCGQLMERGLLGEWQHVEPAEMAAPPTRAGEARSAPVLSGLEAAFAKAGRNDPCPCGSGRKFKHCHGANKPAVN